MDTLDLQDLLPDQDTGAYVYVTQNASGTTIHVTDGTLVNNQADTSGAHDVQTIVLSGYTSANDSVQNILNALTTNQTYTH